MSGQGKEQAQSNYEQTIKQLKKKLMEVLLEKEAAEHEAQRLAEEVTALRSVMEAHIDEIQAAQSAEESTENAALKRELQLIQEQAEADITLLRQQLETAEANARTVREAGAGAASEELKSLKKALLLEKAHLDSSTRERSQLKQHLVTRDREIEHLKEELVENRNEAEEAEFRREEADEARKQVEEALYHLQQQIENSRQKSEFEDERLIKRPKIIDIGSVTARFSIRTALIGVVGCVLLIFGLFGVLTLAGDHHKIVQGYLNRSHSSTNSKTEAESGQIVEGVLHSAEIEPSSLSRPIASKTEATDADRNMTPRHKGQTSTTKVKPGFVIRDPLRSGGSAPAMVRIQGGVFMMGSKRDQLAIEEAPAHSVKVKSFLIGQYEVTFKEYARFAGSTGRTVPDDMGWGRGNRPVINVSWKSATAYTIWLSSQTGKKYRLPTEAEWEYAAAGGVDSPYLWGYKLGKANANCYNCGSRWDGRSSAPVGSFKPNSLGIYNLAGNVMEWAQDCYHGNYKGAPEDGSAWLGADCSERVVRGGAFNKPGDSLRTTKRRGMMANTELPAVGFRVVREL